MNKFIPSLCLLAGLAACAPGALTADERAAIAGEVEARFESLVAAAERGDTNAYFAHFDGGTFTALNASGTVNTDFDLFRVDYLEASGAIEGYDALDFPKVEVRVLDRDTAVLVNEYQGRVRLGDGNVVAIAGGGQQVWQKTDGEWLMVSVGSSVADALPIVEEEPQVDEEPTGLP
ncbi:YybH family protein [Sphingomicrobium sediminis]|uniref:Nuclear transport factor 2 family protein n=1 Tax=Sphingomicrobium sediminis TaxID=2950949 RepID=A0A9X2J1Z2_9SPHN|nr:nuclear transport factor 2 family protein [Sphingomicrobium sediminis]MCM8557753.1 nuclear transport factor 2 family protein [Sphingomicrobium sediminis]